MVYQKKKKAAPEHLRLLYLLHLFFPSPSLPLLLFFIWFFFLFLWADSTQSSFLMAYIQRRRTQNQKKRKKIKNIATYIIYICIYSLLLFYIAENSNYKSISLDDSTSQVLNETFLRMEMFRLYFFLSFFLSFFLAFLFFLFSNCLNWCKFV